MNKKSNLSLLCKVKRTTLNDEAIPFQPGMASLFISYHFLLQILLEPVSYLAKQMVAGIAT